MMSAWLSVGHAPAELHLYRTLFAAFAPALVRVSRPTIVSPTVVASNAPLIVYYVQGETSMN